MRLVGVWSEKETWSLFLSNTLPECPRTQGQTPGSRRGCPRPPNRLGAFLQCQQAGSQQHGGQANSSSSTSGWGAGVHTPGVTKKDDVLSTWPGTLSPPPSM